MSIDPGDGPPSPEETLKNSVGKQVKKKKPFKSKMFTAAEATARDNRAGLQAALVVQAEPLIDDPEPLPPTRAAVDHHAWLAEMRALAMTDLKLGWHWQEHDKFSNNPNFAYYNRMDRVMGWPMVWRFSSIPTTEEMFILGRATDSVKFKRIVNVIDRHTTLYRKDDKDVRLQSFARNLASFCGTELSRHGDAKVKHIIYSAKYLCGIRISELAGHGVSAHPALGKLICIPETEYVLVPTPGMATVTVHQLSTVVYDNPFLGDDSFKPTVSLAALNQKPPPTPDTVPAETMSTAQINAIKAQIDAATNAVDDEKAGEILSNREDNTSMSWTSTERFAGDYDKRFK